MPTGKEVQKIADTAGTGAQSAVRYQLGTEVAGSLQVEITATATVQLEGRLSPDAPWVVLATGITASGHSNLARVYPEMRLNIAANTGTVRAWVMA